MGSLADELVVFVFRINESGFCCVVKNRGRLCFSFVFSVFLLVFVELVQICRL